jgi:hypothetical protein
MQWHALPASPAIVAAAAVAAAAATVLLYNALLTVTRGLSASICLPVGLARIRAAMLRTAALPNVSPTTPTRSPLAGLRGRTHRHSNQRTDSVSILRTAALSGAGAGAIRHECLGD